MISNKKQVKDMNQVKSSVSKITNNLEDHTIELRHEMKSALSVVTQ